MKQKNNPSSHLSRLFSNFFVSFKENPLKYIFLIFTFAIIFFMLFMSQENGALRGFRVQDFQLGKVAEQDLVVDRDIIYQDSEATRIKKEAESLLVPPIFINEKNISARANENYRTFSLNFQALLRQGASSAALYLQIQSLLPGFFTQEDISLLVADEDIYKIIPKGEELLYAIMDEGLFRLPRERALVQSEVELWENNNGTYKKSRKDSTDIFTTSNYYEFLDIRVDTGEFSTDWLPPLKVLLDIFLEENTFYDDIETNKVREEARNSIEPVTRLILRGEQVIQKGTMVTESDMEKIKALGSYTSAAMSYRLFGSLILLSVLYLLGLILMNTSLSHTNMARGEIIFLLILFILYFTLSMFFIRFVDPQVYSVSLLLPSAMFSMMIAIVISPQVAIYSTIFFSFGFLLQVGTDSYGLIFIFITGLVGAVTVVNAEKRSSLIKSSLYLAVIGAVVMVGIGLLEKQSFRYLSLYFSLGFLNGLFSGILNLGIMPFIEHILNSATSFRLRELSDLNTPLFKRMLVLAPGTYSHSISVSNLAETAAREIGANGLLARVGAYYHDIGKIEQAEYFAENQTSGNKHDDLKATLSTAVIKSHVKIGVEKAKELGLPKAVVDIVGQHHGSGLISYFYIQALRQDEGNSKINKEDFSYTGTPPLSREAAIVMLADSVEAASRTLEKPNIAKLEKFVWEIIMNRIKDSQMSRCELTFKDMEAIKKTFVQILAGYFHTRIEYPNENEAANIINGKRMKNESN